MAKKTRLKTVKQQPKPTPTYLKGKKSVNISAHRVAEVFAMIHEHGHTTKFKRQAKAAGISMSLAPKTVNFVKDFVANNDMHQHAVGKQVVNSNGTFNCT
jgi:hypothetical protein